MLLGLHLLPSEDFCYASFLVYQECRADGAYGLLAVHLLLASGTHGFQQRMVHVGNQRKWQCMFFLELYM